jgi:hypothetical protein
MGILGTLRFAVTFAFALPVALMGASFVVDGRIAMGVGFLAVAALMVGLQQYLTTPGDLPGAAAEKVVGKVVKRKDD